MRKTILTVLGAAVLAASVTQIAAAAEHHKARKVVRTPAPVSDQFRNGNAYYVPSFPGPQPYSGPRPDRSEISRYENGAESAPAGH
jgi:hypothetical protein